MVERSNHEWIWTWKSIHRRRHGGWIPTHFPSCFRLGAGADRVRIFAYSDLSVRNSPRHQEIELSPNALN